ncbi:hypothetical protein ASPWEDRAFT_167856 [Aspergillus wentii DTO 134E9]|uniref:Uncharacterized protein n=1 Tax=Aspergillus wentii DTO 134E9 TaxID=1073089 RepID=A0A1L9S3Z8_ASPWE|nr:uncharacterized protein ASPWEDRAFT_167856 [Aspergillus wentii DTO 134E9]KAI9930188.1 hypothetical protein MW887_012000 [Aspergillus wentii]OJJ41863.1 hypothetical protein ASPWEDRAFT_167856 [Aspergillus wentii DTO 134E9]
MANQCSGHVFAIVQATNGNILTWRCSDCNSGPFVAIWRCKISSYTFLIPFWIHTAFLVLNGLVAALQGPLHLALAVCFWSPSPSISTPGKLFGHFTFGFPAYERP